MKEKGFTLINTIGLALGLACFILIMVYVIHEKNYDKFLPDHDRIYRIYLHGGYNAGSEEYYQGFVPYPMQEYLLQNYPEVEQAISFDNMGAYVITYKDKYFQEWRAMLGDSNFFQMFPAEFIIGNSKTALKDAHKIVLTETASKKWFGNENPMGKLMKVGNDSVMFEVTGIIKDPRTDTHVKFNVLISDKSFSPFIKDSWLQSRHRMAYIKLKKGASPIDVEKKLQKIITEKVAPEVEKLMGKTLKEIFTGRKMPQYHLQKLEDIYLDNLLQFEVGAPGNKALVSISTIIAFAILLLACINFINLSTARFSNRMKEICVKKTVGSSRSSLFIQFLGESYLLTFIAIIIALAFVELTIKPFCNTIQLEYVISFYKIPFFTTFLISLFLIVGLLSGTYPAFIMSAVNITDGLRGKSSNKSKGAVLRKTLVVIQFCISFIILLGAFVISDQLRFIQEDNKGYTRKNLSILHNVSDIKHENYKMLKDEILKVPGVINAAYTNVYPQENTPSIDIWKEHETLKDRQTFLYSAADPDYINTMNINLLKGRFFDKEWQKDSLNIIVNEAAVKQLGFKNPIGKQIITRSGYLDIPPYHLTIVGVVKDYNIQPVRGKIWPMILSPRVRGGVQNFDCMLVKFADEQKPEALKKINTIWKSLSNGNSLFSEDVQETLDWQYRNEISATRMIDTFSFICIFIACLGLIGLVSYSTLRRTKEIGIRKANGAEVWQILFTLSKDTMILIGIAIVIALPISMYILNMWLNQYAYHVNISIMAIVLSVLGLYAIALLSEVSLTLKAARQNPVKALRYE